MSDADIMIIIGNILGFIASLIGIGYFKSNNKNKICRIQKLSKRRFINDR